MTTRDDLVSRLRIKADMISLVRRNATMRDSKIMREAASALEAMNAEIARLRGDLVNERRVVTTQSEARVAAESELSTLRARVREVVGPFAEVAGSEAFQFQTREWRDLVIAKPSGTRLAFIQTDSFRAARQLMEEVK